MMLALTPALAWGLLAKRVSPDRTDPALLPRHFHALELPDYRTPDEVFGLIEQLRAMPRVMLIRGTLRRPAEPGSAPVVRRKFLDGGDIVGKPRRVLMYDFDDLGDCDTVAEGLARAINRLPPELAAGRFMGVATAKAKPGAMRLRVISVLGAPAPDRDCKQALWGVCDTALYSPVQPHFTSDPVWQNGATDPFNGARVAYQTLPGEAMIVRHDDLTGEALLALESSCKRISAAKEGNRHKLLNAGAYRMGQYGEHAPADAQNRLYQAGLSAGMTPDRARDEMVRGYTDGQAKPVGEESWQSRLERGQDGKRKSHEVNARIVMAHDPRWRDRAGYNVATCAIEWMDPPPNATGGIEPGHLGAATEELYSRHGISFNSDTLHKAIRGLAYDNTFDPKREWLWEQPWDGVNRIESVFEACFGAIDAPAEYVSAVARNMFLGLAMRVMRPGCQYDELTVLEGVEGLGKSTFFRMLAGEWHGELKNINSEDYVQIISRLAVAELAELSALRRVDDERFKQVVTSTFDITRPKYAVAAVAHPRSCIFVGTTNPPPGQGRYLTSRTGNRRFLPLRVTRELDRAAAAELLPLCLGEARERVLAGEAWQPIPRAREEQEKRELHDPWQDTIAEITANVSEITLGSICAAMEIPPERRYSQVYTRIEICLARLNWTLTQQTSKQRFRLWANPKQKELTP